VTSNVFERTVEVVEHRRGILLNGIHSVKAALEVFITGSHSEVLDEMFAEMYKHFAAGRRIFHKSYEQDGVGPFHNMVVNVRKCKGDLYILTLTGFHTGDEPEIGLATVLDVMRTLSWLEVKISMPVVGEEFRVDFDEVMVNLRKVFKLHDCENGKFVVDAMLETDDSGDTAGDYMVDSTRDMYVIMSLTDVGNPTDHTDGWPKVIWKAEGAVLKGALREKSDEPGKFMTPMLSIAVKRQEISPNRTFQSFITPEEKEGGLYLATLIAEAFK